MPRSPSSVASFGSPPLKCRMVDGGPSPQHLLVLCHGYGAGGDDLVPVGETLVEALQSVGQSWRAVMPAAPIAMDAFGLPGGRAWWPINMQQLLEMSATGEFAELYDTEPPGIDVARNQLASALTQIRRTLPATFSDGTRSRLVLGGFSQGSMLAVDTVLRGQVPTIDGMLLYSSTLVARTQWTAASERLRGLQVVLSHGTDDMILPFDGAKQLESLCRESGASMQFIPFRGGHGIPNEALIASVQVLQAIATDSKADA
jgi:phospholipase/carboxylesterase